MLRRLLVLALKVVGGVALAGIIFAILIPLLPGLIEPWMLVILTVGCIALVILATWDRGLPPAP